MARRLKRQSDDRRSQLLAIEELTVLKGIGDDSHYHTRLETEYPECCPRCGGANLKTHGSFSRNYTDCIMNGNTLQAITMVYQFHKYRCMNPDCRHIFAPEIGFASVNDNVTYRLEDMIADMVIKGFSYESISASLQNALSRQAVGQIFNRLIKARLEVRKPPAVPEVLGAVSGHTDKDDYVLIFSCDEEIRVLDILFGIDSDRITASLRRFGGTNTGFVLTDCDPTVYAAAEEALPGAAHIIPAELWLKLVRGDFSELAAEKLKWVNVPNKKSKVLEPKPEDEENLSHDLKRIFGERPLLKKPYDDYHKLVNLIMNRDFRWTIEELDEWPDMIDEEFRLRLSVTLLQYREYRNEIARHQEYPEKVPIGLLSATDRLEELIRKRRIFSEEALRAAVLYSVHPESHDRRGIPIEEVIKKLEQLQERSGRNK